MLKDLSTSNIYIVCGHTDMRKSIDGLASIVQEQFELNIFSDSLFLFCGRNRNRLKALLWEGESLVADIMQRKFQLGVPLYRQEKYWEAQGIYINRTFMANCVIAGGKWFQPLVKRFLHYAYQEDVLNADETPLKVLKIDGKKSPQHCWMWVCTTSQRSSRKIAIYIFSTNRTKKKAEELFGNYTGILQTDGMASYGSGQYINAGCWSHCRRKFFDLIPKKGSKHSKAAKAVEIIDRAFHLEKEARENQYTDEMIHP